MVACLQLSLPIFLVDTPFLRKFFASLVFPSVQLLSYFVHLLLVRDIFSASNSMMLVANSKNRGNRGKNRQYSFEVSPYTIK